MAKSLGIFVTSPQNMRHVMGVVTAAKAKGSKVKVFFTWLGVHLTKCKQFPDLCALADDVAICVDSYKKAGYDPADVPPGLDPKKMATQAQHGDVIEAYDCYMTL